MARYSRTCGSPKKGIEGFCPCGRGTANWLCKDFQTGRVHCHVTCLQPTNAENALHAVSRGSFRVPAKAVTHAKLFYRKQRMGNGGTGLSQPARWSLKSFCALNMQGRYCRSSTARTMLTPASREAVRTIKRWQDRASVSQKHAADQRAKGAQFLAKRAVPPRGDVSRRSDELDRSSDFSWALHLEEQGAPRSMRRQNRGPARGRLGSHRGNSPFE